MIMNVLGGLNESSNSNTAADDADDDAAAMPDFTLADSIHAHHVGRSDGVGGGGGDDEGERGKMPPPPLQFKPLAFCRHPSLPRWIPKDHSQMTSTRGLPKK